MVGAGEVVEAGIEAGVVVTVLTEGRVHSILDQRTTAPTLMESTEDIVTAEATPANQRLIHHRSPDHPIMLPNRTAGTAQVADLKIMAGRCPMEGIVVEVHHQQAALRTTVRMVHPMDKMDRVMGMVDMVDTADMIVRTLLKMDMGIVIDPSTVHHDRGDEGGGSDSSFLLSSDCYEYIYLQFCRLCWHFLQDDSNVVIRVNGDVTKQNMPSTWKEW